ncbi:MAG: very-short-patch-repair endonuclease [Saprospiraceae bacterium]|jgi:very-short-patch-repair endonuclease
MPKSAVYMWKFILSSRQMLGYQFRRERPILNYIADFVCLELMLVIEVDGINHLTKEASEKDRIRDETLKGIGFTVLRFSSLIVLNDRPSVNEIIAGWIIENGMVPPTERGVMNLVLKSPPHSTPPEGVK